MTSGAGDSILTVNPSLDRVFSGILQNGGTTPTLQVDVTSSTANQVVVAGTTTLNGVGTVTVVNNGANQATLANRTFTIVDGTGALTGQFAGLTEDLDLLTAALSYTANDVLLTFSLNTGAVSTMLTAAGSSPNELGVGSALAEALEQLSPESHVGASTAIGAANTQIFNVAVGQMNSLRGGVGGVPGVRGGCRGDRDGDEGFAYAELGKVMGLDDDGDEENWYLQPQLALQYRHSSEDAFTETGAGAANLSVAGRDTDSFLTALGARVFTTCKLDSGGWLVPDLRLRGGREFADLDSTVRASFMGIPQVFQINGRQRDRDALQVRAGVTGDTVRSPDFDLGYYGEFGDGQQNHAGVLRAFRGGAGTCALHAAASRWGPVRCPSISLARPRRP